MTPLRGKYIRDLTTRGRAQNTIDSYVRQVCGLAEFYGRSPDQISSEEVQDYLFHLVDEKGLAWASCSVAAHSLRFLYHTTLGRDVGHFVIPAPKKPKRLPEILSQEEMVRLIGGAANLKHKTLLMTTYGAGLRVNELTHLKPHDIDSGRMVLWVRGGKGGKDRGVGLSKRLLFTLREYWRAYRPAEDWLFPSRGNPSKPVTADGVCYAVRTAAKNTGIKKKISTHSLRHSFATHLLESGKDLRTIQKLLGHKCISSTMIYLHLAQGKVLSTDSPLDLLDWSVPIKE